ncbi:hypothetical protein ACFLY4_04470 [Chloroflexota bacterium]
MKNIFKRYFTSTAIILLLIGCTKTEPGNYEQKVITPESIEITPQPLHTNFPSQQHPTPITTDPLDYSGLTNQSLDGNRIVHGRGNLPLQTFIDIELPGIPLWLVGAPHESGIIWFVTLEDGNSMAYFTSADGAVETHNNPADLPPGMPPFMRSNSAEYSLVAVPHLDQSPLTHPIDLRLSSLRVYINQNGNLDFIDENDQHAATLEINALPDARILLDEYDRLLLLTDPTDKYNHGVLGDNLEADSITLIETQPIIQVVSVISLSENEVIEGIAPIWTDITGDGEREIIVTVSDLNLGAGIAIFSENGERLAEGPKMGQPFRWRHQIAYGLMGANGEMELVVVRTPHIGGLAEYYQFSAGNLEIVAQYSGITSHVLGSRNLDIAAVGDFDGDKQTELLLPNPGLTELVAVRRSASGAEEDWRLTVGGKLTTNLAGVTLPNGEIALGVGRADGFIRLWLPATK